ncbi:unnamed protein product, partial [Brachionus calyciflorus]
MNQSNEMEIEIKWSLFVCDYFQLRDELKLVISGQSMLLDVNYKILKLFLYGESHLKINQSMFNTFESVYSQLLEENASNELEANEFRVWKKLNENEVKLWVKVNSLAFPSLKNEKYAFCSPCANNFSKKKMINIFPDFKIVPDELRGLKNYFQINKLSLCTVYCNTFQPTNYAYWHFNGKMNIVNKTEDHLKGTFGLILDNFDEQVDDDRNVVRNALLWLKRNNHFYQEFIPAIERIDNFIQKNKFDRYNGFPLTDSTLLNQKDSQITLNVNNSSDTGLIINMDERKTEQYVENFPVSIGLCYKKDSSNKIIPTKIYNGDSDVEPKLFPHLFPYGTGYYIRNSSSVTLAQYFRNRLLNVDPRWREDKFYLFYAYDRLTRERIFAVNSMIKARNSLIETKNIEKLVKNDFEEYFEYGNCVPRSITGSKSYWSSKYYDLISIINNKGLPSLFVTLTANDSWPELKKILSTKKNKSSIFNPVEVSEFFFHRLYAVMEEIKSKNGIFGEVRHYWSRIECQNRGALHAHILLWLKEIRPNLIRADCPSDDDQFSQKLREFVKKYQIHNCVPRRCFKNKKHIFLKCKYGFPFALCKNDHLSADGSKYFYKRTKKLDQNVVQYSSDLLLLWDGHVNVQYVTQRGIEQYLVKYISKVEPTFSSVQKSELTEVQRYFQCRVVSSVEATALVMGHHFVQSNIKVGFIPTNFPDNQFKFIKKKEELIDLDPQDDDIFKDSAYDYYINRPRNSIFNALTIFDYHTKYEIIIKFSNKKIPKPRSENVCLDLEGNKVVKRNKEILVRTNYYDITNGEIYYYQKLLYSIPFYDFKELISQENITKTYREECFLRNLIELSENENGDIIENVNSKNSPKIKLNLKETFEQTFISENLNPKKKQDHNILDDLYLDDEEVLVEGEFVQLRDEPLSDDYEIKNLLNTKNEIPIIIKNIEEKYKSLTKCQKSVADFVSQNSENQMFIFVWGPAGTGKSFLFNYLYDFFYVNCFCVAKLATTGLAAKLII